MISVLPADSKEQLPEPVKLFLEKSGQFSVGSDVSAVDALQKIKSTEDAAIKAFGQKSYLIVIQDFGITGYREKEESLGQPVHCFSDINKYLMDATRVLNTNYKAFASN